MIRGRILYLILIAIIIALAFNAGALATEAKVVLSDSEINSSNGEAKQVKQVENESLEMKINSDILQDQGNKNEGNFIKDYLHKGIYVLTFLLSALMICMLIAMQNQMFFLRKKEQKVVESYEFEVFASDQ